MSGPVAPPGRRSARWQAVAAAVGVLVVLAAIVLASRSPRPLPSSATSPTSSVSQVAPSPSGAATPSAAATPGEAATSPAAPTVAPTSAAPTPAPTGVVPIDSSADAATGVTLHVASIEAVQGEAVQPGEVGGPALRVTVDVTNGTSASVSLADAVVNLYYGTTWTPAVPLAKPGGVAFPAQLAADASGTGTFLFAVPEASRTLVRIEVDAQLGGPVVVFEGSAPS